MLSFDDFKFALTVGHQGPHWINVYVDRKGAFSMQRSGGMGTSIFMPLESDHPYTGYIKELLEESFLSQRNFESQDEAGGEDMAILSPVKSFIDALSEFPEINVENDVFERGKS